MEITNKTLAVLLAVSIIASLSGILYGFSGGITGFATINTTEGLVNLTITQITRVEFVFSEVQFGEGYVNQSHDHCLMDTENGPHRPGCVGFNDVSKGLSFQNTGNTNLSIQIEISKNATTLFGGTNPSFEYKISTALARDLHGITNTEPSCLNNWALPNYVAVNDTKRYICGNVGASPSNYPFSPLSSADGAVIDFNMSIPSDADLVGGRSKNVTVIITGTSIA